MVPFRNKMCGDMRIIQIRNYVCIGRMLAQRVLFHPPGPRFNSDLGLESVWISHNGDAKMPLGVNQLDNPSGVYSDLTLSVS